MKRASIEFSVGFLMAVQPFNQIYPLVTWQFAIETSPVKISWVFRSVAWCIFPVRSMAVYQMINPIEIPCSHHFPMVFLCFSYGLDQVEYTPIGPSPPWLSPAASSRAAAGTTNARPSSNSKPCRPGRRSPGMAATYHISWCIYSVSITIVYHTS